MFGYIKKILPSLVITILDDHHIAVVWRRCLRSYRATFNHIRVESGRRSWRFGGGTRFPVATGEEVTPTKAPYEGGRILIDGPVVLTAGRTTKEPGHEVVLRSVGLSNHGMRLSTTGTLGIRAPGVARTLW